MIGSISPGFQKVLRIVLLFQVCALLVGCAAPSARLNFPLHAVEKSSRGWFYDMHGTGKADFALLPDSQGKLDLLGYDDDGDGKFDRLYRLSDYANKDVPHLIILLDSLPYSKIEQAYRAGRFAWFDPPAKVIPPFPTMTELIYTRLLDAPPLPGMIDQYYERDTGRLHNDVLRRALTGEREPWERRLHYTASVFQSGLAYVDPRPWLAAELELSKQAFDQSPDRVTLVYFMSASAMMSKYGSQGFDEIIDGVERLCLRILYERQGAVKISLLADHGHNLMESKNIDLAKDLQKAGFHPTDRLQKPNDIVMEINGLVTYAAVRTMRPAAVAKVLANVPQVELTMYQDQDRVIVRDSRGSAEIDCRHRRVRYVPIDADVLNYEPVLKSMRAAGKLDAEGYASDDDWFSAALDHEYPDAPRRIWDAFHGTVVNVPEVMLTMKDGYCAGLPEYEHFIHMASTHGGLNQINSATFVMTMTHRIHGPLRSKHVLDALEPGYEPRVRN